MFGVASGAVQDLFAAACTGGRDDGVVGLFAHGGEEGAPGHEAAPLQRFGHLDRGVLGSDADEAD